MSTRAALAAATDQALAELAELRRDPPPALVDQLNMAAKIAGLVCEEFGDDAPLAGRVLVAASRAMAGLIGEATAVGLPRRKVAPLAVNVLAAAGGIAAHQEPGGNRT